MRCSGILRLSAGLPVVIALIDAEGRSERFLDVLDPPMPSGPSKGGVDGSRLSPECRFKPLMYKVGFSSKLSVLPHRNGLSRG